MKISEKSWHYKMVKHIRKYDMPKSLCEYFNLVLACLFMYVFMAFLGTLILGVVASTIGETYIRITEGLWIDFYGNSGKPTGIIISLSTILSTLILAPIIYLDDIKSKFHKEAENVTTFGLVVGYLSAVKNKICPIIEYTDVD